MQQSNAIFAFLFFSFLIYITMKGELPVYMGLLFGTGSGKDQGTGTGSGKDQGTGTGSVKITPGLISPETTTGLFGGPH